MVTWERNREYKGKKCVVCGLLAQQLVAPIGIVSGSIPCHVHHDDRKIRDAYIKWAASLQTHSERSE